jgi:Bacterial SH3 domain
MAGLLAACAQAPPAPPAPPEPAPAPLADSGVYRRADADRLKLLELEVERLRADLRAAEDTLLAVESGLRSAQTRAEAVSRLAEARINIDRAAERAPWRADAVEEARHELEEAERQLGAGHVGSAVFLVSRAGRIAQTLVAESALVAQAGTTRYVRGARVNLRAEPSIDAEVVAVLPRELPVFPEAESGDWLLVRTVTGKVGWVHAPLLGEREVR